MQKTTPRLFISYRREDSIAYAGRLYDHLSAHFGADRVFMDIGQIEAGDDFVKVLDSEIAASDVVIALIGPAWLNASNENGRRLDQPDDFVCHELAAALRQGKRLIPVLVGGATMPDTSALPAAIGPLARHQAHVLDDTRFQLDLDALLRSIERRPSLLSQFVQLMNAERMRKWRRYSAAGIAVLMLCLAWVKLFDANTTSPIRSVFRPATNFFASSFATWRRFFGWKSSAFMLDEMSIARTMSIPSLVTSTSFSPVRGRASATMRRQRAKKRSHGSAAAPIVRHVLRAGIASTLENATGAFIRRRR